MPKRNCQSQNFNLSVGNMFVEILTMSCSALSCINFQSVANKLINPSNFTLCMLLICQNVIGFIFFHHVSHCCWTFYFLWDALWFVDFSCIWTQNLLFKLLQVWVFTLLLKPILHFLSACIIESAVREWESLCAIGYQL